MSIIAKIMSALQKSFRFTFEVVRAFVNGILEIRYQPKIEQEDGPQEPQLSEEEAAIIERRDQVARTDASIIKRHALALIQGTQPPDLSKMSARGRVWMSSLDASELHVIAETPLADVRDHILRKGRIDGVRPMPRVVDASTRDGGIPPSMISSDEHARIDAEIIAGIKDGSIVSPSEQAKRDQVLEIIRDKDAFAARIRSKQGLGPEPGNQKRKLN